MLAADSYGEFYSHSSGTCRPYFRMMFEAFGFSKVSLRCRNLSQLPSGGLLWQIRPLYLTLRSCVVYVIRRIADVCSLVVLRSIYLGLAISGYKLTCGRACQCGMRCCTILFAGYVGSALLSCHVRLGVCNWWKYDQLVTSCIPER